MASMAAAYGVRARWRKAMIVLRVVTLGLVTPAAIPGARADPVRLLVLGDSLSAGFGLAHADGFEAQLAAALHARGHDVRIIDGAVSGDTSAGGLARLDWTLGDGADAAIVELGANDGLRGVEPADTEANLTAILDVLAARHIPVLLTGMYALPNLGHDYAQAFRVVFDRLGSRPGMLYDPFFLTDVAAVPTLNQPDGLHPNPDGVKLIVGRLLPLVEKLLAEVPPA
jgi:acyl-CoA thioesterase I